MSIPHVNKIVSKLPDARRDDFWGHLKTFITIDELDALAADWSTIEAVLTKGLKYTPADLTSFGIDLPRFTTAGKVSLLRAYV